MAITVAEMLEDTRPFGVFLTSLGSILCAKFELKSSLLLRTVLSFVILLESIVENKKRHPFFISALISPLWTSSFTSSEIKKIIEWI